MLSRDGSRTFTGMYGFVLLPDLETEARARKYAQEVSSNALDLKHVHQRHLTLFHTKVVKASEGDLYVLLANLWKNLPIPANFTEVASFGGKFAFWDAERSEALQALHEEALGLAQFFDRSGAQQADSEALQLSEAETRNVREYGHPLVRELWRPHITVGYVPGGYDAAGFSAAFAGSFNRVAFVRVGEFGTVAEIISVAQK
ncbi:2'-5' RNA ligase family protein [Candidatus Kaiserbacteria bacterium]|nr:2'-5' RNA ligase family protein [Candidatus Kaiserbacteria bacterium]